jgi:hypothetical protein
VSEAEAEARLLLVALCAVLSNAINTHALTSVRKSLIAGTSQDRRPPFSSPLWRTPTTSTTTFFARQFTSCDTAPQLVVASPAASRPRLHCVLLRLDCAITCNFRNISTFTHERNQPAGSRTQLAVSRRFWIRQPTQRQHKRPTCKRGTAA